MTNKCGGWRACAALVIASMALSGCLGVSINAQERPLSRAMDDFNTRTELNARLLSEDPVLFANVSTTVIEGRVHLAGTVSSQEDRMQAARTAWSAPSVTEVVNNIEVTSEGGIAETASDRWTSAQVRGRILGDGSIRDSNYTIDTQNSVVYVMGIGQDGAEIGRVLAHASAVPGVRRVVNYALTKDDPRRFASRPERTTEDEGSGDDQASQTGENDGDSDPPVLSGEFGDGYASSSEGSLLPTPVEETPLPPASGPATGAPRPLTR